jgi:glycosyltransferase involved in cell wall biosynthesis
MKIAYFSPFPPKQTGIALYSEQLVRHLRELAQVKSYDFWNDSAGTADETFSDFARSGRVQELAACDAVIYHLGNNPHFHVEIFKLLRQFPGIVVLHDVVIYYLIAGLGPAGLTKHLWINYGRRHAADIEAIIHDSAEHDILRYPYPEKYPLTASVFPHATRIIVHNRSARDHVVALGYSRPVHVIPHLTFSSVDADIPDAHVHQLTRKHSIKDSQVVIGCLGFIGPTKRLAVVCEALQRLRGKVDFRLLIVGAGDDVSGMIAANSLDDVTIRTTFVDGDEFSAYLRLSDIVVNLRYPSMGESSGTLTRAMALGKPCIVTNSGSFADLPSDAVEKISVGPSEVAELAAAIDRLAAASARRGALGAAALRYTQTVLDPSVIAQRFVRAVKSEIKERAQSALIADANRSFGQGTVVELFQREMKRSLPAHLRESLGGAS